MALPSLRKVLNRSIYKIRAQGSNFSNPRCELLTKFGNISVLEMNATARYDVPRQQMRLSFAGLAYRQASVCHEPLRQAVRVNRAQPKCACVYAVEASGDAVGVIVMAKEAYIRHDLIPALVVACCSTQDGRDPDECASKQQVVFIMIAC